VDPPGGWASEFVVPVGEAADPPVLERPSPQPHPERLYSEHFSTWVFTCAWRGLTASHFWNSENHWAGGVTAREPSFGPMELDFLKEHFREGPADHTDPDGPTYYFFTRETWVRVRRVGDLRGEGTAYWELCAATRQRLAALLRQVWPCGALARTLFCPTAEGQEFLRRVRAECQSGGF
jgi:hypothetical protein